MACCRYLFALQFSVGPSEGMALVVAENSVQAFDYVKSMSEKSYYNPENFVLEGSVKVANYDGLQTGVVFESFVNAAVAFDAIRSMAPSLKGDKGDTGPQGIEGPAGRGIASIMQNADYSLTFRYTDRASYTTSSFKVDIRYNTTAYWNNASGFIPGPGEIIIYSDYDTYTDGSGYVHDIPRIKIGTGNAYVQDLVFADEKDHQMLIKHVSNAAAHVSAGERTFWNNKLNVVDDIIDETLELNRN